MREVRHLLRLAVPLAIAEMGWVLMNFVDLAFIGRVSTTAMAAVAIGNAIFIAFAIIAAGTLLGLDALVSQAFGASRTDDCHRYLWASVTLCVPLSIAVMAVFYLIGPQLIHAGYPSDVVAQVTIYLRSLAWGIPPLMGYFALRRYLQGIHLVAVVPFAMISANLVNAAGNYILIFGHFGMPPLGVLGSGISTAIARFYILAVVLFYLAWQSRRRQFHVTRFASSALDFHRIREILRLGAPAAAQISLEVGVFSASTLIAGRIGPTSVAAHQIALEMASFTFMVPLGISAATAVRVGNAIGARDPIRATFAGWTGAVVSIFWMTFTAFCFWLLPRQLVAIFTNDVEITRIAVSLLYIAAIFQLFDGLQVVLIGALRGSGNTRTAMLLNVVGWWMISLPLGCYFCFTLHQGVHGIWIGLCVGDILIAVLLAIAWTKRMRKLRAEGITEALAKEANAEAVL